MVKSVIKRDGRTEAFDPSKIEDAILKAFVAKDKELSDYAISKAKNIATYIEFESEKTELTVEEIQDLVEKGLMSTKRKDVARKYIVYREERNRRRTHNTPSIKEFALKLLGNNDEKQNANVDALSFGGRKGEASNVIMKQYALDYLLSDMARANHINNEIYIHDLDSYAIGMHNCLTVPFDDLLAKGFDTRQTDVRPANSISTAFQLVAVIFQLQSLQQFGGVSASHLDWTMVPYVRKSFYKHYCEGIKYIARWRYDTVIDLSVFRDTLSIDNELYKQYPLIYEYAMEKTEKECLQAVEGMYHNLNTLQSRSGNQLPFTSINYGTCTLPEGRMIIKALLEGSLNGVGHLHKTSIFPCGIFQCMKDVNRKPGDPNYDLFKLALKSTAKRLYPNYANVDWSGNAGYDINDPRTYFSTMGLVA